MLSANLRMQDTFFIHGIFADEEAVSDEQMPDAMPKTAVLIDVKAMIVAGSKLEGSQLIPIIAAGVLGLIMSVPSLYGILLRMRVRREYDRQIKEGRPCGMTVINWY